MQVKIASCRILLLLFAAGTLFAATAAKTNKKTAVVAEVEARAAVVRAQRGCGGRESWGARLNAWPTVFSLAWDMPVLSLVACCRRRRGGWCLLSLFVFCFNFDG